MSAYLAVDIGTSSIKAIVFDSDSAVVDGFHETLPAPAPQWSPDNWLRAFCKGLSGLRNRAGISAVCISGNGPTVVPVFRDGTWDNAMLWCYNDQPRSSGIASYFLPKIQHYINTHSPMLPLVWKFLTCPGFLAWQLTGEGLEVSPHRGFDSCFWTAAEADTLGIDKELLPDLIYSGDLIGKLSRKAAEGFGLSCGIPVFGGGLDYLMALLGTATVDPGNACDRAGTSEGINYCSKLPVSAGALRSLPHVREGFFHVSGLLDSSGRVFEWLRQITGQSGSGYIEIMKEICACDPAAPEPRFFPSAHRGASWEFDAGMFAGLHPYHTRADMGKAVVEAIGFGIRDLLAVMQQSGCTVQALNGSGGQMRNPLWTQMKATIIGVPIKVPRVIDAELLGCLCCMLTGLGRYDSLYQASRELVRFETVYEPDASLFAVYDDNYNKYVEERDRLIQVKKTCHS